ATWLTTITAKWAWMCRRQRKRRRNRRRPGRGRIRRSEHRLACVSRTSNPLRVRNASGLSPQPSWASLRTAITILDMDVLVSTDAAELASKIARLVEERGWNQEDFARATQLNRQTVRHILGEN